MSWFSGLWKHTDTACIFMWTYAVLLYKELGRLKSKTRQHLANHEVWNFFKLVQLILKGLTKHPQLPDHPPPLTPPFSYSLTLLLQLYSALKIYSFYNKLKLKSSKVCFILPALPPVKPQWKMAFFPKTIAMTGRPISSWPIIKSQTAQIMPGCSANKKKPKKQHQPHCLLKNVGVLIFSGQTDALTFHSVSYTHLTLPTRRTV